MVEEGFINNLMKSKEMIPLTIIIFLMSLKVFHITFLANNMRDENAKGFRKAMEDRKPTIEIDSQDLEGLSIDELMKIKASGLYILPKEYDDMIRTHIVDMRRNGPDDINDDILDIEDNDYAFA